MPHTRSDFLIVAHMSDLHLRTDGALYNGDKDTRHQLMRCIQHLNQLEPKPDLVIATGDLADEPTPADYEELRRQLAGLSMPVYVIPGNHDDRDMLRAAFETEGYFQADSTFLHYCIETYPLRMIALDTVEREGDAGEMCPERLSWLDDRLSEQPTRPTMIFMHHQPKYTRIGYTDYHAFDGAEDMEALIARHAHVEWIACGHLHRPIQMRWGGSVVSVAPSASFARTLTLDNALPKAFIDEAPGVNLYLWALDSGVICHTSVIGDFGAPFPMRDL